MLMHGWAHADKRHFGVDEPRWSVENRPASVRDSGSSVDGRPAPRHKM